MRARGWGRGGMRVGNTTAGGDENVGSTPNGRGGGVLSAHSARLKERRRGTPRGQVMPSRAETGARDLVQSDQCGEERAERQIGCFGAAA